MDSQIPHLKALTKVSCLVLEGDEITDAGLQHLEQLENLSQITDMIINSSNVTDAGLRHVEKLTSLRELHLTCPQITAIGLRHLQAPRRVGMVVARL